MTSLIRDLDNILLDTGPFCRFAEGNQLGPFAQYLGDRAMITQDVDWELRHRSNQPEHVNLQMLEFRTPPFPEIAPLALTAGEQDQVQKVQQELLREDDPDWAHIGETSTVICANRGTKRPVLIDDGDGRRLAQVRELPLYGTAQLLAEMVVTGALAEDEGSKIFFSLGATFDEARFQRALARYREFLAEP